MAAVSAPAYPDIDQTGYDAMTTSAPPIGHNSQRITVTVQAKLFNSLNRFSPPSGPIQMMDFPAGATVGDLIRQLNVPLDEIFLVLRNGRDITPGLVGERVNTMATLDDGDVIALSGPVPYSYGYGAPVV